MADEQVDSPQLPDSGASAPAASAPVVETQNQSQSATATPEVQAGGQGAGSTPTPAPAAPPSLRDQMAGYGLDVSGYQDDASLAQALAYGYRGYQSARPHLELSSRWLPYASEIERFLQERQQQGSRGFGKDAEAGAKRPWHQLPEFNPLWRHQIQRNEQGEYVPIPGSGATLETVRKFQEYAQARRDFEDRFYSDPVTALKPGLDEYVQPLVQQAIQQSLAQMQEHQYAQSYTQRNADWLYARDAQGQELRDPVTGGKVLTPYGERFAGYLREAHGLGVQGAANQQRYAQALLERDLALVGAMNGQQPQQPTAAANGAQRQAQRGGTKAAANGDGPPQNAHHRLRDAMRAAFAEQGIKNEDLQVPAGIGE